MKTASLDREIRARVDAFVTELTNIVKISTLQAVHDALSADVAGASSFTATPARRGPGRPKKSGTPSPLADAPKASRRGGKRTSEDVLAAADAFHAYVQANEGQRLEEIARGLGIPSKELKLPVQKLFEQKRIKTTGVKRGTKYFAK